MKDLINNKYYDEKVLESLTFILKFLKNLALNNVARSKNLLEEKSLQIITYFFHYFELDQYNKEMFLDKVIQLYI